MKLAEYLQIIFADGNTWAIIAYFTALWQSARDKSLLCFILWIVAPPLAVIYGSLILLGKAWDAFDKEDSAESHPSRRSTDRE